VTAEAEREKEELTEYDGWIPSSEGLLDPLEKGTALSCSRLETLAKCPFAYFIQFVLGVEPLEEIEKDMLRWLDPLQNGQLLHEVFHLFMTELIKRGERLSVRQHAKMLEEIAMEAIERWKADIPPAGELSFEKEKEEVLVSLDIFLRDEEERCRSAEPLFLELSFGLGGKEEVRIGLGDKKSFGLRGRIDRVDRVGEHEYEVWDYKTGSSYGYKEEGHLDGCKHLQHALYGLAAESILHKRVDKKARVTRSGYFFPSPKGEGLRIHKSQDRREKVYEALRDLIAMLQRGTFPACCDGDPCGHCDYAIICGGKNIAVFRSKIKLEKCTKMGLFKKVMSHA
jgi:ATP-dependent helicase/nuclease subunit B